MGLLAGSSLVIGAVVALRFRIGLRVIGLIMGFGAACSSARLAFESRRGGDREVIRQRMGRGGLFAGCAVFFGGDG
jgi:ZIP family zinc transporter